jgi:hypothetical protein
VTGGRGRDVLAELVRRVDLDEVARRIVTVYRAEIPSYAKLPDLTLRSEVQNMARRMLGVLFRSVVDDRAPSDHELQPFRDIMRFRAGQGVPLEDVLHACRLGGRLGWEALVAVATEKEEDVLLPTVARLMGFIDRASDVISATYHEELRHLVSDEERRVHELFEELQRPAPLEPRAIELAQRIGFPAADRYVPFAAACEGPSQHARLAATLRKHGALAVTEGAHVSGLLAPGADPEVLRAGGARLRAVGPPTPRAELGPMLVDLRLLVDIGQRRSRDGDLTPEEFLPELLLARSPHLGVILDRRVYGPLESAAGRGGADLLATINAFLATALDRRAAAERLHVHPNTLDYRLRRIEELTGLRFADPDAVMLMALALRRRRLERRVGERAA